MFKHPFCVIIFKKSGENMKEKVNEVLNKMKEIGYGWVEPNGVKHFKSKQNYFKEFYRIMPIDKILEYKVGTCFESAKLTAHFLKEKGIPSKSYMINYTDPNKLAKHTFTVCNDEEHYYLVESSWVNEKIEFDNLNDLITSVIKRYPRMYKIENLDMSLVHVYEIDEIPDLMSLDEFVNFASNNEIKIK